MPRREDEDPAHPILADAWTWRIIGLNLQFDPIDDGEPYIDLTLKRGTDRRVLRFWSPQNLEVEEGGPAMTSGLVISDVRGRGLDRLGVRVWDFEASPGAVRFWARDVEERTAQSVHIGGPS